MPLGERLRGFRHTAGLTMEQLSESSGVSVRAISDMERGHIRAPQPRTLAALAAALALTGEQRRRLEQDARALRLHSAGARPRACEPPRPVTDFVGRSAELTLLQHRVDFGPDTDPESTHREAPHLRVDFSPDTDPESTREGGPGPVPVVVVHGQPGIGKTAFAVQAAEMLRDRFPDGCLFLDLRGVDPEPATTGEVATQLLKALDVRPRQIVGTDEERCGLLRATLRHRRCLVVFDNVADEAQLRPLLPGTGTGLILATSRRVLGGLEGVLRIGLAPLAPAESATLLKAIAGQAGDPAAADDVDAVGKLCGHLPLALRIAGTRLANRAGWTVGHLVDRLADADRRLACLHTGDTGVAAALALSHAQLSGEGRALFRRLAHVPGPDFAAPIVAVLTGSEPDDATDRLDELVELGLLEHEGPDRYRFHDLIRIFAAERLRAEEPEGSRIATRLRMAGHILRTVLEAENPGELLRAEEGTVLGALRIMAEAGEDRLVAEVLHVVPHGAHPGPADCIG